MWAEGLGYACMQVCLARYLLRLGPSVVLQETKPGGHVGMGDQEQATAGSLGHLDVVGTREEAPAPAPAAKQHRTSPRATPAAAAKEGARGRSRRQQHPPHRKGHVRGCR